MIGRLEYLRHFRPITGGGHFTFGNDANVIILGFGVLTSRNFSIQRLAYVDGLKHNLIIVGHL